ncbi:hypothetical protein E2C01_072332 [Portunus trituberculatus]|uniref:Uncharacterized protein n=1 Tax=Portunus trituberculatus TaxID=210409 RepID=A0A5B7I6F2_PORTR|nr:hypothetical protein [Portunus trituberculatus]
MYVACVLRMHAEMTLHNKWKCCDSCFALFSSIIWPQLRIKPPPLLFSTPPPGVTYNGGQVSRAQGSPVEGKIVPLSLRGEKFCEGETLGSEGKERRGKER